MAARVPLTMCQGNDEIIDVAITPVALADDLSLITSLKFYLKPDACTSDADTSVTVLTSAIPTQIVITHQTSMEIDATVYVPAASLADPYSRVWRIDAYAGTAHRTAMYGPVTIIDM